MARRSTAWGRGIAVIVTCLMACHAWGQERPPGDTRKDDAPPVRAPSPALPLPGPLIPSATTLGPPLAAFPLELLGLMVPQRGGFTLTPSIAVSEEYNDNILLDNSDRQADFITYLSPALSFGVSLPSLQLVAGYTTSVSFYARDPDRNSLFESHNFLFSSIYQATPGLTLTLSDAFVYSRDANSLVNFVTGRQTSWSNTVSTTAVWQMTPTNTLSLGAGYTALRFESGAGNDSDAYGFTASIGHAFTPRFTGILSYGFGYLDLRGQDNSITHTPAIGFSYQITRSLSATITGGPSITETGGETFISPAGSASLQQELRFGSVGVRYDRGVYVAGEFGGTTDTQTISASLALTTLARGLVVVFNPGYSVATTVNDQQAEQVDVKAFTLTVGAVYSLSRYVSIFGGYRFFHQRTGASSTIQNEVDMNQVKLGLQFGYPFNF